MLPEGVQTIPAVEMPEGYRQRRLYDDVLLAASKAMRKNPREVAKILTEHMDLSDTYFTSVEIAGPGFLNFRLGDKWYADVLAAVEEEKGDDGRDNWLGGKKYMVEFVSANPTGPMHMGNARGGVLGDTLARGARLVGRRRVARVLRQRLWQPDRKVRQEHRSVRRLRKGKCTIELGFILSDVITNFERVSDHCSNIAVCLVQVNEDEFDTHAYLDELRQEDNLDFQGKVMACREKYQLPPTKQDRVMEKNAKLLAE